MKHTPGPWWIVDREGAGLEIYAKVSFNGGQYGIFQVEKYPRIDGQSLITFESWMQFETEEWSNIQKANAQRIVDCVNACEGIEDPIKLKEENEKLRKALSQMKKE